MKMKSELGRSGSASSKACCTGVQGASQEIRNWVALRWQHTNGYPVSEKNKEGIEIVLQVQTLSQHRTIHGGRRRKEGEWVARALS